MALSYEVEVVNRAGVRRVHKYVTDTELRPGDVLRLDGRFWLVLLEREESRAPRLT